MRILFAAVPAGLLAVLGGCIPGPHRVTIGHLQDINSGTTEWAATLPKRGVMWDLYIDPARALSEPALRPGGENPKIAWQLQNTGSSPLTVNGQGLRKVLRSNETTTIYSGDLQNLSFSTTLVAIDTEGDVDLEIHLILTADASAKLARPVEIQATAQRP